MTQRFAPLARVLRGGLDESWHLGVVVVVRPGGEVAARAGDPRVRTFLRSAAKPFQAMPLLVAGGQARFALDAADVALICASHAGRPEHADRAAALLGRGGFAEGALLCGAHDPFDDTAASELRRRAVAPAVLHNNCSGKHAGMLLACRLLGESTGDYISPQHPLQRRVLEYVARCCGASVVDVGLATDGCSAPTFQLTMREAARGYAALAAPRAAGLPELEAAALDTVFAAMTSNPEMVAGPGRFTTRLMQVTAGRVLGKEGAEGFYAAAIRSPEPLGIAVKVADGGERARDGIVMDVLAGLGALRPDEMRELRSFHRTPLLNHRAFFVGEVVPGVTWTEPPPSPEP